MTALKSEFLCTLQERGFIHQCTDLEGLDALMAREKITAYIGFDCTAPSLHVGSLMQIMILRWLQKTGHKPIVLMGGGTTKIGDPSGKDESRQLLTDETIAKNMSGIKNVFSQFLKFGKNANESIMVNNDDWLKKIDLYTYLREVGRHFSINRMLTMDSVKLRLEREQNLSFLEFNYMILQAYDFVELNKKYNCRLQIGGSDQWGNIVNGVELGRRVGFERANLPERMNRESSTMGIQGNFATSTEEFFGLTSPLITTSSGAKMGKTAAGAVWLNAEMRSPYDYWQFWRNTEDADVGRFLRFFTELPIAEIQKLEKLKGAEINEAKVILANEATRLCHGEAAAAEAAQTAQKTFSQGMAAEGLPTTEITRQELESGQINVRAALQKTGLAESGGDAKKLILGGGVLINDEKVTDPNKVLTANDASPEGIIKITKGKKHHALIKISS